MRELLEYLASGVAYADPKPSCSCTSSGVCDPSTGSTFSTFAVRGDSERYALRSTADG